MWNSKFKTIAKIKREWKYTPKGVSRTLSNICDEDFFQKLVTVFNCYYFHREAQSQMFESVLKTPQTPALSVGNSQIEFLSLR